MMQGVGNTESESLIVEEMPCDAIHEFVPQDSIVCTYMVDCPRCVMTFLILRVCGGCYFQK